VRKGHKNANRFEDDYDAGHERPTRHRRNCGCGL
jgi:hypothetical protein